MDSFVGSPDTSRTPQLGSRKQSRERGVEDPAFFDYWRGLPESLRMIVNSHNVPPRCSSHTPGKRADDDGKDDDETLGLFLESLQWEVDESGHLVSTSPGEHSGNKRRRHELLSRQSSTLPSSTHPSFAASQSIASSSAVAFPYAVHRILENPENRSWIQWNDDGTEFQFCNWDRLLECLNQFGLSARQKESVNKNFHDYGFTRLTDSRRRIPDRAGVLWCRFRHANFQRDRPELVRDIFRRMVKLYFIWAVACLARLASTQCANPVPRPEIRSLSPEDRAWFFRALAKIRSNGELDRLSRLHVDNADTIHGHPRFLAFHRYFVYDFAQALNKAEPGVPVPYWDWSLDATQPATSELFTDAYCGGNGSGARNCVQSGPFANWQMKVDSPHCLAREFNQGDGISPFWPPEALLSMQQTCTQYGALSSGIENGCHGAVHLGISGDMSTMFAPNDPFFFLHHGMVDKLWYDWQLMEPNTRFQLYDNVNYDDPPVSSDESLPGYPSVRVRDVLDPRSGLCYVYVDSGSHAATKRLMQEVNRQAALKNGDPDAGPPPRSSSAGPGPGPAPPAGRAAHDESPHPPGSIASAANAAGNGTPSPESAASLNDLTTQVSRLSGNGDAKAGASQALHRQQVDFLQNTLLNGLTPNRGLDLGSASLNRNNRLLRRRISLALRENKEEKGLGLDDILTTLAGGLLGKDGLVGHLLQGLGNVVAVLPKGLGETLKAVGSIAENVTNDVFDLLKLPKVDLSKLSEQERRIPYVAALPDWWYQRNNLNATYAAQLHSQVHEIIDGFNRIPGYVSPAIIHYAAKKYGEK
ncbi:Di-copper centre-containing protein [Martensiomyces pterosporus]|nr:Di-copper centre-containing protein [Martensiomyces pterosporus]